MMEGLSMQEMFEKLLESQADLSQKINNQGEELKDSQIEATENLNHRMENLSQKIDSQAEATVNLSQKIDNQGGELKEKIEQSQIDCENRFEELKLNFVEFRSEQAEWKVDIGQKLSEFDDDFCGKFEEFKNSQTISLVKATENFETKLRDHVERIENNQTGLVSSLDTKIGAIMIEVEDVLEKKLGVTKSGLQDEIQERILEVKESYNNDNESLTQEIDECKQGIQEIRQDLTSVGTNHDQMGHEIEKIKGNLAFTRKTVTEDIKILNKEYKELGKDLVQTAINVNQVSNDLADVRRNIKNPVETDKRIETEAQYSESESEGVRVDVVSDKNTEVEIHVVAVESKVTSVTEIVEGSVVLGQNTKKTTEALSGINSEIEREISDEESVEKITGIDSESNFEIVGDNINSSQFNSPASSEGSRQNLKLVFRGLNTCKLMMGKGTKCYYLCTPNQMYFDRGFARLGEDGPTFCCSYCDGGSEKVQRVKSIVDGSRPVGRCVNCSAEEMSRVVFEMGFEYLNSFGSETMKYCKGLDDCKNVMLNIRALQLNASEHHSSLCDHLEVTIIVKLSAFRVKVKWKATDMSICYSKIFHLGLA